MNVFRKLWKRKSRKELEREIAELQFWERHYRRLVEQTRARNIATARAHEAMQDAAAKIQGVQDVAAEAIRIIDRARNVLDEWGEPIDPEGRP